MRDLPTVRRPSLTRRILAYLKRCIATLPDALYHALILIVIVAILVGDRPLWAKAAGFVLVAVLGGFLRGFVGAALRHHRGRRSEGWTR